MGNCQNIADDPAKKLSSEIDKDLKRQGEKTKSVIKILLLGPGITLIFAYSLIC
jgi:hypothetical protein